MSLNEIITRKYDNFRGVDFRGGDVASYRSPNALNMWKDYKEDDIIQTRPGMKLIAEFSGEIYGLFFYNINNTTQVLVHIGTKLLKWTNYPNTPVETTELFTGLNPKQSTSFIFNNIFFLKDGINYLEYNGTTAKQVEGTIPITSYYKNPDGSTHIDEDTDVDFVYQPINVLTSYRKNRFIADGTSVNYQLDDTGLDEASIYLMRANVDGITKIENIDFSVDRETGIVTFETAPINGAEVEIQYSKTIANHRERILNCNLLCEFDNRLFFSGNPDYPNAVFHCELNDPRYIRDNAYYECGLDKAQIKAIIPGNNALWVLKELDQNSSSVYYLSPTLDENYNKIYPSVNGSISLGCVSTGINFNDDIVFFSKNGLEGISSSSLYSEQILQHRSSFADSKMVSEINYDKVKLAEYSGYLMCLIDSHIYLADKRKRSQTQSNDIEYEWFYWELPYDITYIKEYRGTLYLANNDGQIFILNGMTDNEEDINSYWTTFEDDLGYPAYTKTTNKRGGIVYVKKMDNDSIKISTIVDGITKEKNTFSDEKGYIAYRIKDKKFKKIQIKFSSNKQFGLFQCTLQGFIAGYVKR